MRDARPVVILAEHLAEPVYHLFRPWHEGGHETGRIERDDGTAEVWHRERLECGRVVAEWSWIERDRTTVDHKDRRHGVMLRRDHAESFARLCSRCAP